STRRPYDLPEAKAGVALVAQPRPRPKRIAHRVGTERPLPHRHQREQAHEAAPQLRVFIETAVDHGQAQQHEVVERDAARDPLAQALALHRADASRGEGGARLLAAQLRERVAIVVVQRRVAGVEDETDAARERVRAEDGVLAAVALVEAEL